ncbi:hypothetical protein Nepgr_018865 [Nepenthes gracilis]|uniref:Uncharacterized protein n=1 Tax=Nepenthes gracilis TaxID=150966 RepID=A0AAD3XUF6_NEPGR|nr:hypothetical protein Nepgr_018865 [Nepenthes gracilis]
MKKQFDRGWRMESSEQGDWIFLRQLAFKLDLPVQVHIHQNFHASWLKKIGYPTEMINYLPMSHEDGRVAVKPENNLEYMQVQKGGQMTP